MKKILIITFEYPLGKNYCGGVGQIVKYVWQRLVIFQNRRKQLKRPHQRREYTYEWFQSLGIYRLMENIRYPSFAYSKA